MKKTKVKIKSIVYCSECDDEVYLCDGDCGSYLEDGDGTIFCDEEYGGHAEKPVDKYGRIGLHRLIGCFGDVKCLYYITSHRSRQEAGEEITHESQFCYIWDS